MPKVELSEETVKNLAAVIGGREPTPGEAMRIVVANNRGLTFVGRTDLKPCELGYITIYNARCIIYWGTTQHLAEIASGPTDKTKLGARHAVRIRHNNIVAVYECGGGWLE